jgi:hypothetical protein
MALIVCKECGSSISKKANKCPNCGAPRKRKTSIGTWLVVVIIVLYFIGEYGSQNTDIVKSPPSVKEQEWSYSQNVDPMTSKTSYFASLASTNTINFKFPYNGEQRGEISLSTHPHRKNIVFSINQGQFLCTSYRGCYITVRFDENPPKSYDAVGPRDGSTTYIFIQDYASFVERLQKSKKVLIQAEFYQEGLRTFEFNVKNFDPKRYVPSK